MSNSNILRTPILIASSSIITYSLLIFCDKNINTNNDVVNFMKIPLSTFTASFIMNSIFQRHQLTQKENLIVSFGICLYTSPIYPLSKIIINYIYNK
jgi:hypothetical protein